MKKTKLLLWTRYLGLCLMAVLLLSSCGKGCAKKEAPGAESGILSLIPAEHNLVIGVHWKKMVDSPIGTKLKEDIPPQAELFLKDLQEVIVAFNLKDLRQNPQEAVAILSGPFDPAVLLAKLKEEAQKEGTTVNEEDYEGNKLYSSSKDPTLGMAFVNGNGVIGKKTTVKKVIGLSKKQGASIETNQNMVDLMKGVDTNRMLWAVGVVPEGAIPAGGEGSPLSAFAGVKALDLALDASKGLSVDVGIIAGTPEDAKKMETTANSYKTLFGGSLAKENPDMGKVLENLQIKTDGKRVALTLRLDEATVEKLSKQPADGAGVAPAAPAETPQEASPPQPSEPAEKPAKEDS